MELIVEKYCPFSHRCILVLLEKGIPFETVEINLSQKQGKEELLSPYDRVPVLRHNGLSVYESSIIMEYLEEISPTPRLLPESPGGRATARFWVDYCNTRFMPAYFNLLKERNLNARPRKKKKLLDCLEFIETKALANSSKEEPYWLGQHLSLADFAFYPFFERFISVEAYRGVLIPEDHGRLSTWLEAMRTLESVRKVARSREKYLEYFAGLYAD